eukprot:jgi/Tetstr1/455702/TSEL_042510.t1
MERIPPRLRVALLPFQVEGVSRALSLEGRVLVGDEMGLGKTLQALALAAAYAAEWPLLVVAPSSMRWAWVEELERWLGGGVVRPGDVNVVRDGKNSDIGRKRVTIVTYPLCAAKPVLAQLQARRFQVIICDESHYIKNMQAKRTQAILPLLKSARRVVLLSGTPALGRPIDLYPQLDALRPGSFGSIAAFGKRYCGGRRRPWGWDYNGASNLDELHERILTEFMYRRLKSQVLAQLPPKRRQCIQVELPADKAKESDRICASVMDSIGKLRGSQAGAQSGREPAYAAHRELRQALGEWYTASGRAKAEAAMQFCAELLEGGVKLLVFAHHLQVLDALEDAAKLMRIKYIRVDGSTPSQDRHEAFRRFQTDDSIRCAVLSVTACGTGVTLTAASDVVFAELHWTPAVLQQAEDRCHRIGQAQSVNVRYIIGKGTSDEVMWPAINRKLRILGRALDGCRDGGLRAEGVKLSIGDSALGEEDDASASVMDMCIDLLASRGGTALRSSTSAGRGGGATQMTIQERPTLQKRQVVDKEDIRFFFGGGRPAAAKRPKPMPEPVCVDLTGGDNDPIDLTDEDGGADLAGNREGGVSHEEQPARPAKTEAAAAVNEGLRGDASLATEGKDRAQAEEKAEASSSSQERLVFDVSPHTGRVFLWDAASEPPVFLNASFLPEVRTEPPSSLERKYDSAGA